MNQPNLSQQLEQDVDQLLQSHNLSTFRYYWELYKRAFRWDEIQAYYLIIDPATTYGNVAMLGHGKLIDIDGDDSTGAGYLGIQDLASIGAVIFRRGQIEGFSHSQGASLVVFTRLIGEPDSGPYWVARTELDEERLIVFARLLVDSTPTANSFGVSQ